VFRLVNVPYSTKQENRIPNRSQSLVAEYALEVAEGKSRMPKSDAFAKYATQEGAGVVVLKIPTTR
jgi:hypothetical protein